MPESSVSIAEIIAVVVMSKKSGVSVLSSLQKGDDSPVSQKKFFAK
jgi:hypothetical protein